MRKLVKCRLFKNFLSGISVSLLATILVLLITELCLRYYLPEPDHRHTRLIFFAEGEIFKNKDWGSFVYQPNAAMRSTVFYIFDGDISTLSKEYENDIKDRACRCFTADAG